MIIDDVIIPVPLQGRTVTLGEITTAIHMKHESAKGEEKQAVSRREEYKCNRRNRVGASHLRRCVAGEVRSTALLVWWAAGGRR